MSDTRLFFLFFFFFFQAEDGIRDTSVTGVQTCALPIYHKICIFHKYGEIGFLKDTDFVIESDKAIYLVEYKNANVPGAAKPDAFRPEKDIILNKVAEKYFDTLHCLYLLGKNKPKKYIYVLEYPNGNSTSRLMIRNLLQKKLPFRLQTQLSAGKVRLIDEVKVVNIEEWNADPELGRYPIKQRKTEESEKVKNEE